MLSIKAAHEGLVRFAERVQRVTGTPFSELSAPTTAAQRATFVQPAFDGLYQRFREFLDDDFNTGGATGVLFELVTRLNRLVDQERLEMSSTKTLPAMTEFREGTALVREIAHVLGLQFSAAKGGTLTAPTDELHRQAEMIDGLMMLLIDLRNNLRAQAKKIAGKDDPTRTALFEQTDVIRRRLAELGITLEDRAGGTDWRIG
jgi:cysteinyl-tRNA synthetase